MITKISTKSIGKVWQKLLRTIMEKGQKVVDGDKKLIELCHVIVDLPANFKLTDAIFESLYDKTMIKFMQKNFFGKNPIKNWGYSYGQRFSNYHGIDQIADVTRKLRENPWSKSATICLADPLNDQYHAPCIYSLDFKLRNKQLTVTAYFRSQDAGKKFCADIYCIRQIQQQVAKETTSQMGSLLILSSSMHIYRDDLDLVKRVISYDKK